MRSLLLDLCGKLRSRFTASNLFKVHFFLGRPSQTKQAGFIEHGPTAAFVPGFGTGQMGGFLNGERHQEPPEVVAVLKLREPAGLRAPAKRVKSAEGYIFFVGHAEGNLPQFSTRQADEARKKALPKQ